MTKKYCIFLSALFCAFLGVFLVANAVSPDRTFSQMENRNLEQLPVPSVKTLLNGQFMKDFETYTTDQFVGRDGWIALKSTTERVLGKKENNNVYFAAGDTLISRFDEPDGEKVTNNLNYVNNFVENVDIPVTFSLIPTQACIWADRLPAGAPNASQTAILEQAKKMIADGVLGKIHTIAAEYPQEWVGLNTALRGKDGLTWRVDPAICGPSGVIADIGTHVEYLISKVTGLKPVRVLARLRSIPDYVPVESDAQVLIDYDNGAAGIFWTSFAMVGKSCCMKVRIYGDKGGMEWNAHDFMELRVDIAGQPTQIWSANYDYCDPQARKSCRLPKGMPEAFHSLFANFYRGYCSHLLSRKEGKDERPFPYSDIDDGIQGLKFIEACLKSQEDGNVWTQV